MPDGSSTAHLYRPKLATVIGEGYGLDAFRRDAVAGLTVAVVALPLSMAIAVASGVSPERGLYTSIVGGFLVSALGGSRFQIGGPAGAFIVLVAATAAKLGLEGLLVTVLLSGLMLTLIGVLRIGALIRYIPHAVTIGFTLGIACTIGASQLKDLGGLALAGAEPGRFFPKIVVLAHALPTVNMAAAVIGIGSTALIFIVRVWRPAYPGMLIAVALAAVLAYVFRLPVETIGTRFGGVPALLPAPQVPQIALLSHPDIWMAAVSFTLLGGVESLLSAKVADGMTGRKHRSNMELVAQGIANMASALFGGISVTGTIARTATNIRAGARSPMSGMLHAMFLLVFMAVAAPLASYVPLSALAGVLVVVCWNMAEKREAAALLRTWQPGSVMAVTFLVTLVDNLTVGIIAGCLLAAIYAVWSRWRGAEEA